MQMEHYEDINEGSKRGALKENWLIYVQKSKCDLVVI